MNIYMRLSFSWWILGNLTDYLKDDMHIMMMSIYICMLQTRNFKNTFTHAIFFLEYSIAMHKLLTQVILLSAKYC